MMFRKAVTATVAGTLALVGTASASAAGERIASRQAADVGEGEQLAGVGTVGWIIALAIAAGAALVIIDDDDNDPVSP